MMKLILSAVITVATWLNAQDAIGGWTSHTSPLTIRQMVQCGNQILCATSGGLLEYNLDSETFRTNTNMDGLTTTDLCAIAMDSTGNIWLGGGNPEGIIQVYDIASHKAVRTFDFDLTEIIEITTSDSLIFVAYRKNQDLGLMEFIIKDGEFQYRDVYKNWQNPFQTFLGIAIRDPMILIATDEGMLSANYRNSNLKNPASWSEPFLEISQGIQAFYNSGTEVIFQYENDIYKIIEGDSLATVHTYFNWALQNILITDSGVIWGNLQDKLLEFGETGLTRTINIDAYSVLNIGNLRQQNPILCTKRGLAFVQEADAPALRYRTPNAPLTNHLSAVKVLKDGRIVAGSTSGIAILGPEGWRNIIETLDTTRIVHSNFDYRYFAADTLPIDCGDYISDIEEGPDGFVYLAVRGTYPEPTRHGGGIIIIDIDDPLNFTILDTAYLDYFYVHGGSPYMVVKDLAFDSFQNLWAANAFATHGKRPIAIIGPGMEKQSLSANTWTDLCLTPNTIDFDGWGRAWVGSFEDPPIGGPTIGGLAMLTMDGNPVENGITSADLVPIRPPSSEIEYNQTVWSLAITSNNRLFALTPLGLDILDLQASNSAPVRQYGQFRYFPNISFTSGSKVRLDAAENTWVTSPNDGIHVLLNNASFWPDNNPDLAVEAINTASSFLLSNNVTDIDFNDKDGIAVITTNMGLNTFRIPFADSKPNYKSIRVFPSPFFTGEQPYCIIDNLMDNTSVQILSFDGRVLRKLENTSLGIHGYQVRWDGRNDQNRLVGSGVYLISAYDLRGNQVFEKITVIRK